MQSMRDSGMLVREIAATSGRSTKAVKRYTTARPKVVKPCPRLERLSKLVQGRNRFYRDIIARQHGYASAASLSVILCKYRQKMRQAEGGGA
jgi:hypothetical protein